jgi:hypothetical protein
MKRREMRGVWGQENPPGPEINLLAGTISSNTFYQSHLIKRPFMIEESHLFARLRPSGVTSRMSEKKCRQGRWVDDSSSMDL